MSAHNLESHKLSLIHWITELQDVKMIEKLLKFQTENRIPQWQVDELDKRTKEYEENPSILLDFENLEKNIKLK